MGCIWVVGLGGPSVGSLLTAVEPDNGMLRMRAYKPSEPRQEEPSLPNKAS